jgi:hypothetical protein
MNDELAQKQVYLFPHRPAFKVNDGGGGFLGDNSPEARPGGALIHYAVQDSLESDLQIEVIDSDARLVQVFSTDSLTAKQHKTTQLKPKDGLNRINWDLTYEGPTLIDGAIVWGYTGGVKAPPGTYDIRLTYGDEILTQQVEVREDPRIEAEVTEADYEEQLRLGLEIRDAITAVHESVSEIRSVKEQIKWMKGQTEDQEVNSMADSMLKELTALEEQLMQTKNESNQDPIRFAPRLDNQLVENYNYVTGVDGYISGGREGRPSAAAYERWTDLDKEWTELKEKVETSLSESVESFNELVRKKNIIGIKRKATKS